jgi:hypothetical protein
MVRFKKYQNKKKKTVATTIFSSTKSLISRLITVEFRPFQAHSNRNGKPLPLVKHCHCHSPQTQPPLPASKLPQLPKIATTIFSSTKALISHLIMIQTTPFQAHSNRNAKPLPLSLSQSPSPLRFQNRQKPPKLPKLTLFFYYKNIHNSLNNDQNTTILGSFEPQSSATATHPAPRA